MRLFLIVIIFFILVLLGLITLNGEIIILSIPLAVYIGAAIILIPPDVKLKISREIAPKRVVPGGKIEVFVQIHNIGSYLREAIFRDIIPDSVNVINGDNSLVADLHSNRTLEFSYKLTGNRGIHHLPGLKLISGDPYGLFPLKMTIRNEDKVKVLPQSNPIKSLPVRPKLTKGYSGIFPSARGGRGIEFYGVREYQPGDSMNIINWVASARSHDSFFSNEFQVEKTADIWLILDARRRSDFTFGERSLFENMVEITASVAHTLLHYGNRVGLLIYGGFLDWTFLGYGKKQREKLLAALMKAKTGESRIFDKLENLPTRIFPPRTQIIFISPLHGEDYRFLASIKAQSYQVLCISPDPIPFEQRASQFDDSTNLGIRLARLERSLLLSKLRYSGVQVLNIDPLIDLKIELGRSP
jgi:uncharacterized protein (DUF58 family)